MEHELSEASLLVGLFQYPRLKLVRGEGTWVWDSEGKKYLDFTAGLAVNALGHGRADLADIMRQQFMTLAHCSNLFGNEPALRLADKLVRSSFASRVWFCNSGAEANEAALKFARLYGLRGGNSEKINVVACRASFHGRTIGSVSVTHEPAYREPFGPLLPGVTFIDFNDSAAALKAIDGRVCAVIVEPVQGEGGVTPADESFLRTLREACNRVDALLIFDEIQCGMGRTGNMFGYQHYNVTPDIMTLAKPLAGGLPIGATLINDRVADLLRPGQHGSTFAGGPVVCAVGERVFDIIHSAEFLAQVRERATRLHDGLAQVAKAHPEVFTKARGLGLMQGLVLRDPQATPPPEVLKMIRSEGMLATRAGKDTIRFLPPLNVSHKEIDLAVETMHKVAQKLEQIV